jgi:hypothetical protein
MKIKRGSATIDLDNNATIRKMLTIFRLRPYKFLDYEDFADVGLTLSSFKWYVSMITSHFDGIYRISKGNHFTRYMYLPEQTTNKEYTDLISGLTEIHSHASDIITIVRENILRYIDN